MAETILQTIAEYARLRVKEAKRSIPLEAVSYTHLTLPTT